MLNDPALEARARALSEGLRCLVCQNQSIDDSNADLARDLRILVRQRLVAGDTDEQVMDYVVVALRRVRPAEAALRAAHTGCCGVRRSSLLLVRRLVHRADGAVAPHAGNRNRLSAEEQAALDAILRRD